VSFFRTGALRATFLGGGLISAAMPLAKPSSRMRARFAAIRACRTRSYSFNPTGTVSRLLLGRTAAPRVAGEAALHSVELSRKLSPLSLLCCPVMSAGFFAAELGRLGA
jgi:hypothetical protein